MKHLALGLLLVQGAVLWGEAAFDPNGNAPRDADDPPAEALVTIVGRAPDSPPKPGLTDLPLRAPSPPGTPASQLALRGSTLYIGASDRIRTADLTDPLHPALLGESPAFGGQVRSVSVMDNLAAVALTGGGIQLLSVSDPHVPVLVSSYPSSSSTAGVAFAGAFLLVPNAEALDVLDVSTPANPRSVATYRPTAEIRGVTVAGPYAYVVTVDSWLRIVDVADPTRPTEIGAIHIEGAGFLAQVAVANGNAFGTFVFGHLAQSIVIDVTDPSHPRRRPDVDTNLYGDGGFAIQSDVLYAANRGQIGFGSVGAIAIGNPAAPSLAGSLTAPWNPLAIGVRDSLAYVLGGDDLLHVVDLANPAQPRGVALAGLEPVPVPPPVEHDERYFAETGYRVAGDAIWEYFLSRGGLDVFGYPVSRPFGLLGCGVQVFQRTIAQTCAGQGVQLMNVLDPDLFPYTRANSSTLPEVDPAVKAATPQVSNPDYAAAMLDFVRATAPDEWHAQPVNFGTTFFSLVTAEMAGTDEPGPLGLLNLEVWGAPISRPVPDPNNSGFIYQRFQRGVMHFDASTGVTRGILVADYVKAILRGVDLPPDLRDQAGGSSLFTQYCPGAPNWLCRPDDLQGTDLTLAFEPG